MKPWEKYAAPQTDEAEGPRTFKVPKPVSVERRAEGERRIAALDAERADIAQQSEDEMSLGGRVMGTLEGIVDNTDPRGYLKDYGQGIATSLEDAPQAMISPVEMMQGVGAPLVEYPLAMAAGAAALPFSGSYGGVRDAAFENLNDLTQTPRSKKAQNIAGAVLKPIGDIFSTAGKGYGEIAGALGAPEAVQENISDIAPDVLGMLPLKAAAPKGTPGLNPHPPKRAPVTPGPTADPLARARDAGYTIPASARTAAGKPAGGIVSRVSETASGKSQMQHRVNQKNDLRVLEGIRKDLGLPENAAITKPAIDAILGDTGKVYEAVRTSLPTLKLTPELEQAIAGVGEKRRTNPLLRETPRIQKLRDQVGNAGDVNTGDVIAAVQEFRDNARLISRNAEKPEQIQMAQAYKEMADVMESGLDTALTASGRPDLIPSLKNARIRRAKAHQALEAVSGTDRPGVSLMKMKQRGEMLSGEMDLAADVTRDMSAHGQLSVDMAAGAGKPAGDISNILQGAVRPLIQPALTSEFAQKRMFGPRVPESLSPYEPKQYEIPSVVEQGELLGPGIDLETPTGRAGGAMPSDVRRRATQVGPQSDAIGSLLDLGSEGAVGGPIPSRLRVPEQAPSMFSESLPIDLEPPPGRAGRRTRPEVDLGESERRSRIIAERQAVLDRPVGTRPNAGIADELLNDTGIRRAVSEDTLANRAELNPGDQLPVGGIEPGVMPGPIVPETGEFVRRSNTPEQPISEIGLFRSNADIGDMIGNERVKPTQGEVTLTREDLQGLGFSDEEIAQLLGEE